MNNSEKIELPSYLKGLDKAINEKYPGADSKIEFVITINHELPANTKQQIQSFIDGYINAKTEISEREKVRKAAAKKR